MRLGLLACVAVATVLAVLHGIRPVAAAGTTPCCTGPVKSTSSYWSPASTQMNVLKPIFIEEKNVCTNTDVELSKTDTAIECGKQCVARLGDTMDKWSGFFLHGRSDSTGWGGRIGRCWCYTDPSKGSLKNTKASYNKAKDCTQKKHDGYDLYRYIPGERCACGGLEHGGWRFSDFLSLIFLGVGQLVVVRGRPFLFPEFTKLDHPRV